MIFGFPFNESNQQKIFQTASPEVFFPGLNLVLAILLLSLPTLRPSSTHVSLTLDSAWYCSTISQFLSFCDLEQIPIHAHCPVSENLLCAFATSHVGSLSGTTVHNHMAALKAWHAYLNKPWLGSVHLNYMINGVTNLAPASLKHLPHPPITRAMLLILTSKLNSTNSFNICCFAAVTWEILSQWDGSFMASHIPCRLNLSTPLNSNGSCKLHLPFTKVKKTRGKDIILCHINFPLFCFYPSSGLHCLTCKKFLAQCNSIWASSDLATSSAHSFHISGTTKFLLAGVPPDIIKALGHWSSDSFLCYWHSLEPLTPLHVENL
ncbi:hypothetical protein F4604DRAFT_1879556 [Suillus subluteus]|nr:hypothetical protein F4604DRAFT_1879556 [Suillus subluteus]